jgi:hypothetical protein
LLCAGAFLLPLVCVPGLEHPFSTPKVWLIAALDLFVAARYIANRRRAACAGGWPWLGWGAALALSALLAPLVSIEALLLTVLPVPLCLAAAESLPKALMAGSAVQSAVAVLQWCGADPLLWLGWRPELFSDPRMRVYGTLGNPDFVAAWGCAMLPVFAAAAVRTRSRMLWAGLALQLGAVLATGSRIFLLAGTAAAAMIALRGVRGRWWWIAGLAAAGGALVWLSPARPLRATVDGRLYLARVAAGHWREIPVFGFGAGSFEAQFARWQVEAAGRERLSRFAGQVDHAHNDYLEMLVEYGPAGLCASLGLWIWLMASAWRTGSPDTAGAWGGIAALLAAACADFPFHRPAEWGLFWVLLGIATVTYGRYGTCYRRESRAQ